MTQRTCYNKFPPQIEVVVKDTTIYRDTVLYAYLPADTVRVSDTIYINKNGEPVIIKPLVAETDFARAEAWVKDLRLHLRLFNKDTALELRYDSLLQVKQTVTTVTKVVTAPPKFNGVLWQVIALLSILLFIVVVIKLIK